MLTRDLVMRFQCKQLWDWKVSSKTRALEKFSELYIIVLELLSTLDLILLNRKWMFDFLWSCSYHKAAIGQWRCEIPIIMKRPPHNSMKPTMNPMRYQWHSLHTGFLGESHLLTEQCSPYRTAHLIQTKTTKTSWYIELVFCCWIVRKHQTFIMF